MSILVFNSGSSSLKFQLYEMAGDILSSILRGNVRDLGEEAICEWVYHDVREHRSISVPDHQAAARLVLDMLDQDIDPGRSLLTGLTAVGHRVVHGADVFLTPTLITEQTLATLDDLTRLAPLHNPPALMVMRVCRERLENVPMVAVFDTAFFHELSDYVHTYALPSEWLEQPQTIRRYGFHGLAHRYMSERYFSLNNTTTGRLITLQLGHGCSITAIRDGHPLETSMGFTPLEGLIMATRPGDLDVGIVLYLLESSATTATELNDSLNHRAGLLGLSGISADMQELLALESDGHSGASLAIEAFCHRIRKYLGAYLAVLGGADAIIFGGGIGEHAPEIRSRICSGMKWFGLELDVQANQTTVGIEALISTTHSETSAYVIPVDEESLIAQETLNFLRQVT